MGRYSWGRLSGQQVGRFAEYFVKMEFALYGFEIYTAEVDDRGIDFVARYRTGTFYEVQVKSVRDTKYVFMEKTKFPLDAQRILTLVRLTENQAPELYLIQATAWLSPSALLVGRDYPGLKSRPEWGIRLSARTRPMLDDYRFDVAILPLCADASGGSTS
jgi:hypothetical protein